MRIYLLNPPYFPHFGRGMRWQDTGRGGTLYYPIWLAYAAAILEQANDVRLVDAPAWKWELSAVIADIQKYSPELTVIDSSFPSLKNDISVAGAIKKAIPYTKIVLVGPPTSQYADRILQSPGVDIVARLEYDLTLKDLAENLSNNRDYQKLSGISFKSATGIIHSPDRPFTTDADLDAIPFVSKVYKKHLHIKNYFLGNSLYPEVQIFAGRGCPFQCTFCAWPQTLMGHKYRVRSINNILDEMEWIQSELPQVKEVFLEDDTFPIDEKRVNDFCEGYKKRKLKITWSCNARVGLQCDTMKMMSSSNCRLLIVGFESGNDQILKNIKKGISVASALAFAGEVKKSGLLLLADFIIGLPGETVDTIAQTRDFIKKVKPDLLQVSVASPFPGTEFYAWAKANKYLTTEDPTEYLDSRGHQKAVISYPQLDSDMITNYVDLILKEHYLSPSFIPILLRQIIRKNGLDEITRLFILIKEFTRYLMTSNKSRR